MIFSRGSKIQSQVAARPGWARSRLDTKLGLGEGQPCLARTRIFFREGEEGIGHEGKSWSRFVSSRSAYCGIHTSRLLRRIRLGAKVKEQNKLPSSVIRSKTENHVVPCIDPAVSRPMSPRPLFPCRSANSAYAHVGTSREPVGAQPSREHVSQCSRRAYCRKHEHYWGACSIPLPIRFAIRS